MAESVDPLNLFSPNAPGVLLEPGSPAGSPEKQNSETPFSAHLLAASGKRQLSSIQERVETVSQDTAHSDTSDSKKLLADLTDAVLPRTANSESAQPGIAKLGTSDVADDSQDLPLPAAESNADGQDQSLMVGFKPKVSEKITPSVDGTTSATGSANGGRLRPILGGLFDSESNIAIEAESMLTGNGIDSHVETQTPSNPMTTGESPSGATQASSSLPQLVSQHPTERASQLDQGLVELGRTAVSIPQSVSSRLQDDTSNASPLTSTQANVSAGATLSGQDMKGASSVLTSPGVLASHTTDSDADVKTPTGVRNAAADSETTHMLAGKVTASETLATTIPGQIRGLEIAKGMESSGIQVGNLPASQLLGTTNTEQRLMRSQPVNPTPATEMNNDLTGNDKLVSVESRELQKQASEISLLASGSGYTSRHDVLATSASYGLSSAESTELARSQTSNMYHVASSGIVAAPVPTRTGAGSNLVLAPGVVHMSQNFQDPALAGNIRWMANEGISNATINVSPGGMGPISVQVMMEGEKMSVSFYAGQAATREALDVAAPRLREQLQAQGHEQVRVDVSDNRSDSSRTSQQHLADKRSSPDTSFSADSDSFDDEGMNSVENESDYQHTGSSTSLIDAFV